MFKYFRGTTQNDLSYERDKIFLKNFLRTDHAGKKFDRKPMGGYMVRIDE